MSTRSHTTLAKIIHWSFILLFIYAILKGLDDVDQLADRAFWMFEMVFASAFLVILLSRFIYMRKYSPSVLPDETSELMKKAARYGHLAVYGSIAMIAITGLIIGTIYASGITSGLLMDAVIFLHETSISASYLFIAIHIAAAIYHRFKGDGIWSAMVPFFKE